MSDNDVLVSHSMFSNAYSYMGLPFSREFRNIDLAVLGIPYDLGTTGRAGARHGPQGIRLASANLRWEERRWPWTFDAFEKIAIMDYGDLEFTPGETLSMINTVIEHVGNCLLYTSPSPRD